MGRLRYHITRAQLTARGVRIGNDPAARGRTAVVQDAAAAAAAEALHGATHLARILSNHRRIGIADAGPNRRRQVCTMRLSWKAKRALEEATAYDELCATLAANGLGGAETERLLPFLLPRLRGARRLPLRCGAIPREPLKMEAARLVREVLLMRRLALETDLVVRARACGDSFVAFYELLLDVREGREKGEGKEEGVYEKKTEEYEHPALEQFAHRNPRDEALAALFLKDFGPSVASSPNSNPGSSSSTTTSSGDDLTPGARAPPFPAQSYAAWYTSSLDHTNSAPPTLLQEHETDSRSSSTSTVYMPLLSMATFEPSPPWQWYCYPVPVRRAYTRDRVQAYYGVFVDEDEEHAEVERGNQRDARRFEHVCEAIRRIVQDPKLGLAFGLGEKMEHETRTGAFEIAVLEAKKLLIRAARSVML